MKHLFSLINTHFFNSIINPFFAFLFPSIFMIILGLLLGYPFVFGGLLALPSMTISLILLPLTFFEFKNSILLKRIVVTKIKPWMFIFVIFLYYFVIMIISTIILILVGMAVFSTNWLIGDEILSISNTKIFAPSLHEYFLTVNWFNLIWGIIMNILIGSSIGIFVVSFSKSVISIQGITIPILIISQFLAAQVLPVSMVKDINALWILGYFTPFRYSTGLIIESWNSSPIIPEIMPGLTEIKINLVGSSIFNINENFNILTTSGKSNIIYEQYDKILNLIMPFIIFSFFILFSLKLFKSNTR